MAASVKQPRAASAPSGAGRRTDDYAAIDVPAALQALASSSEQGLTQAEAAKRLAEYGPNEVTEKEEPLWHRIFRRFWGPIPWMIEAAAALSALVHKWEDFAIILVMLLVNAGLDFLQEHRARNALRALKQRLSSQAIVLRGGKWLTLPVRQLVPGDIVRLRGGDIVPADVKLIGGDYLLIDQAALTGESLPVSHKAGETAYANTIVKQGEMVALVVNTGMHTNFSSVVALVARAQREERSHFQKMVMQIGNFLIVITLVLVAVIVLVALFRHQPILEIARFALVLTVAAIPVALPAVLSVTMAVGALNLARRQAIVSKLTAIEELAGIEILCSDKTGTLTENRMRVSDPVPFPGFDESELFRVAALASRRENNDPIEQPIFQYIDEHLPRLSLQDYRQTDFTPFDPTRKRAESRIEGPGCAFTALKGAPQVLMDLASLSDDFAAEVQRRVDQLAGQGYRTLAVGRREEDAPVQLIGLIPLFDPPREDSAQVIRDMADYGVAVKMVTGDHIAIAKEIGRILGLKQEAVRARQLSGSGSQELLAMTESLTTAIYRRLKGDASLAEARHFAADVMAELKSLYDTRLLEREFIHTHESAIIEMIEQATIFAEVVPEDKFRIVDTLQKGGHLVAMTGDGVNDAPALKKADCGFAVSNATDAARAAADIVLTSPGLSVISEAIEQARIIFGRMKSYATFRIAETLRIILFMTLSILIFDFYPITALMIILLALLNDLPILSIAYDNTRVHREPMRWRMGELLTVSTLLGVTGVISTFVLFFVLREYGVPDNVIQSILFLKLIVAGHSTLYVTRAGGWFWERPWPSPLLFLATFGTEILGTLVAVYGFLVTPIGWEFALWTWAYALGWFVINDLVKVGAYRWLRVGAAA
jgi:H+-transporting ATPase